MSWFRAERGPGFFGGFFRRPSTLLLGLALALFAAQLFPLPGIYLMFLGGALWTGILVALLLVAIAVEAWTGYLPRAWLLLPLGALASYYATAIGQRADAALIGQSMGPVRVAITFDPTTDHLLLDYRVSVMGDQRVAARLFDRYALDTVFVARQRGGKDQLARRTGDGCRAPARDLDVQFGYFRAPGDPTATVELCLTENATPPAGRWFTAERERSTVERWYRTDLSTIAVSMDPDLLGSFTVGTATLMGWIPLVAVGCGLVSGPDTGWRCGAAPLYGEVVRIGYSDSDALAIMLGLPPRGN